MGKSKRFNPLTSGDGGEGVGVVKKPRNDWRPDEDSKGKTQTQVRDYRILGKKGAKNKLARREEPSALRGEGEKVKTRVGGLWGGGATVFWEGSNMGVADERGL